jgi:hypothetical protein
VVLVKGTTPVGTMVVVKILSGKSYTSNVNDNGDFMVMGLPGTYKIRSHHHFHYCQYKTDVVITEQVQIT